MALVTLGMAGAVGYDAAAALFVDGKLVAAIEEERLLRRKHARRELPFLAARQCLQLAGVRAGDVDQVAISSAPVSLFSRARWHYAWRHWYAPDRGISSLLKGNRRYRRHLREVDELLEKLRIPRARIELVPVEHQLAHAASCYHLNESSEKTAIFCIDARAEYANIFLGCGENGRITRIKEFYNPDSLCDMYAALTDYLGFQSLDGEFKVMGIAPFGDPDRYDLSALVQFDGKDFRVNNKLINTVGLRRYKARSRGHYFSRKLVEELGPRRAGNLLDDPWVHYAAGIQKLYEDIAVGLVVHYLGPILNETHRLAVAGTGSMNIRLNRRLASLPFIRDYIVHPACGDAGSAIGAAAWAIRRRGLPIEPLTDLFLGPGYTNDQCIEACTMNRDKPRWEILDDPFDKAAELLANGQPLAWFRGRMEFGPRALGNRSILADPTRRGIADAINQQVKFRERWRPFSPSILDTAADELLAAGHKDPWMCMSLPVSGECRERYPAVVYKDGTTRAQVVTAQGNPDFHRLLRRFQQRTGHGLLLNATLCRPGEALVCSPEDAVAMFMGTDLNYLIMEDLLVTKREETQDW